MSQRVTRNLKKYMDSSDVTSIRIGIREILINAIEHGNLNIKFNEKTQALIDDTYFQFVQERQKDPRYLDKQVTLEYSLNEQRVAYKIEDEGNGFDYQKILDSIINQKDDEALPHGRGLIITLDVFDSVKFNKKGNQVLLLKYFNNNSTESIQE